MNQHSRNPKAKSASTKGRASSSSKKSQPPKQSNIFSPTRTRTPFFDQPEPLHPLDLPRHMGLSPAQFSLLHEIHHVGFVPTLLATLIARAHNEHNPRESVLIQGLQYQGSQQVSVITIEQIFERLHLAHIPLHRDDLRPEGKIMIAIRNQLAENAATCGVMGSTNKAISLCINLAKPEYSGESTNNHLIPTSLKFDLPLHKRPGDKRIYNVRVPFSVTVQTTPRRDSMWNHNSEAKDLNEANWRLTFMMTWLHKDLDFTIATLIMDMDMLFRNALTEAQHEYLVQNIVVSPIKPYFTNDGEPNPLLKGGGVGVWIYGELENTMYMTMRNKLLNALIGAPSAPYGLATMNGIRTVFYQSPSESQPFLLDTANIPKDHMVNDYWLVRFINLPTDITTLHMLTLLTHGYKLGNDDILNIVMEFDRLNDNNISMPARGQPCMTLLLASADVLRTILTYRSMILQDLQHAYQSGLAIAAALRDDPSLCIGISSPHATPTSRQSLPRLGEKGLTRQLAHLTHTKAEIHEIARLLDDTAPEIQCAPWYNTDQTSMDPLPVQDLPPPISRPSNPWSTTSASDTTLLRGHLFASPPRTNTRGESPKRGRGGDYVTPTHRQLHQMSLRETPPTNGTGRPPPSPPTPAAHPSLDITLARIRQDALNDPTKQLGVKLLDWAIDLAVLLRDADHLPEDSAWRLVGQSGCAGESSVTPSYNLPPWGHNSPTRDSHSDFQLVNDSMDVADETIINPVDQDEGR